MNNQSRNEPAENAPQSRRGGPRPQRQEQPAPARSALHESEERYRTLFNTMDEGFVLQEILYDPQGRPYDYRFLEVNPAFQRQTGLSAVALVGRTVREVLPGIEPVWFERLGRVALTGRPEQFEVWSETRRRWHDIRAYPTAPGRLAAVLMDITERKQAEQALQESHERSQGQAEELQMANEELHAQAEELHASNEELRRQEQALRESEQRLVWSQEIAHLGSWELDVVQNRLRWSDEVYRIFGLQPRQFGATYEAFLARVHPDDRVAVDAAYSGSLRENRDTYEIEHRVVRPGTGEIRFVHEKCRHLRDDAGRVVRSVGMVHDVTERKALEAQLRRLNDQLEQEVQAQTEELKDTIDRLQEEVARRVQAEDGLRRRSQMLEAFFLHTITPLAFLDRHFNFVRVNEAYAQADQKDPDYFPGKNHFVLYPHAENRRIFEQVVRTKQPYFAHARSFTYPGVPRRVTYWDWQLTPLLDEQGEVQFLVLNLEDVTEQQTAFHELQQRARQLQKLTLDLSQAEDRERKRLAEILHDDLQQQLAAAKFHLSLLGSHLPKDTELGDALSRLDQILKNAIETSRSLSHELSPAVLYQSTLGETFEWLARQLKAKHGLTVHVENRDRVEAASDALKIFLYKAAREILFNIVKHARVKEARLRLQRLRGRVWLTISDQGRGFDPRSLGKTGGFGLLSIRERIELLGGRMRIRSAPGRGSTFVITVPDTETPADRRPRTEDGEQPDAGTPSSALGRPSSVLRVLLVDDHQATREGLAAVLSEQADLAVVGQAANGHEAVRLACELRPDVIVMDVSMPMMAGDEATRQIKRRVPGVRVVALSMFDESGMAQAMCEAGAQAYLLKTAPPEQLLAAIRGGPDAHAG
ncbi:MAG: PAS domain S-box protein [Planctomycetes bacterium]|nr:PAS domain S-box protein [Planctomycetota bacterium]